MSFTQFLVLLLTFAAVLARPQPQDSGAASERDSLNEDEEEEKICISFKGNSMAEVNQVKGELPTQLIFKLSGNSKPRLVHYKVVTVDGSSVKTYPTELQKTARANIIPTKDSTQDDAGEEGNRATSQNEKLEVLPYRNSSLNGSMERKASQIGNEPADVRNNTGGSDVNNGSENALETGSQTVSGMNEFETNERVSPTNETFLNHTNEDHSNKTTLPEGSLEAPYQEGSFNGSMERNVSQIAVERPSVLNNTRGSVVTNETESTFKTGSQIAGGMNDVANTSNASTDNPIEDSSQVIPTNGSLLNRTNNDSSNRKTLPGEGFDVSHQAGSLNGSTERNVSQIGTERPGLLNNTGVAENGTAGTLEAYSSSISPGPPTNDSSQVIPTYGSLLNGTNNEDGNRTTFNSSTERNVSEIGVERPAILNNTGGVIENGTTGTLEAYSSSISPGPPTNDSSQVTPTYGSLLNGTNNEDGNRTTFNGSTERSESQIGIEPPGVLNNTGGVVAENGTAGTLETGSQIDGGVDGLTPATVVSADTEDFAAPATNAPDNGIMATSLTSGAPSSFSSSGDNETTELQQLTNHSHSSNGTKFVSTTDDSGNEESVTHPSEGLTRIGIEERNESGVTSDGNEYNNTTTTVTIPTEPHDILNSSSTSGKQPTTTSTIGYTPVNISEEFRGLPFGEEDETITFSPPTEVETNKTGFTLDDTSTESFDKSNATSEILLSDEYEIIASEDTGNEENAIMESTNSTMQTSEIILSPSGEVLGVLSSEDSIEEPSGNVTGASEYDTVQPMEDSTKNHSEIVFSPSGEVLDVLSSEDSTEQPIENGTDATENQNNSTAGNTDDEDTTTDGFRDLPIEDKVITPVKTTVIFELSGENVTVNGISSSGEQAETQIGNTHFETTQSHSTSTPTHTSSAGVIGSLPVATSSHHQPGDEKVLIDSQPQTDMIPTTAAMDIQGLPVSGSEYDPLSVSEATRVTEGALEGSVVVTLQPPENKNIPIFSSHSESASEAESGTKGTPVTSSQRPLEDWEKFNNFTVIIPYIRNHYRVQYPVIADSYQPGGMYKVYDGMTGQIEIVQLPMARQI